MKHIDKQEYTKAEAQVRAKQIRKRGYRAKAIKQRKAYKVEYWT